MNKLMINMKSFMQDDEGVTAIEYGLIAALIAVVIIGAVTLVGTELTGVFGDISDGLSGAGTTPTPAPTE